MRNWLRSNLNLPYIISCLCFTSAGFIMDNLGAGLISWQLWAMFVVLVVLEYATKHFARKETTEEITTIIERFKDEQEN